VKPLYGKIERPVLILWGEEDTWIPPSKGKQLHKAIPASKLRIIPRCAHLAQEDATETVIEHLARFFSR
jgi:pimeloyl-ACP methyl ester carboxylesterase